MGEGVKIKENPKSKEKKDKTFFITLISVIQDLDERTLSMMDVGIDLSDYENPFMSIIEGLVYKHYGDLGGEIIFWWLAEIHNKDEGKNLTIQIGEDDEIVINTPLQLYNALKKLDKYKS